MFILRRTGDRPGCAELAELIVLAPAVEGSGPTIYGRILIIDTQLSPIRHHPFGHWSVNHQGSTAAGAGGGGAPQRGGRALVARRLKLCGHYPGRKSPFLAVKRPARQYKSAKQH